MPNPRQTRIPHDGGYNHAKWRYYFYKYSPHVLKGLFSITLGLMAGLLFAPVVTTFGFCLISITTSFFTMTLAECCHCPCVKDTSIETNNTATMKTSAQVTAAMISSNTAPSRERSRNVLTTTTGSTPIQNNRSSETPAAPNQDNLFPLGPKNPSKKTIVVEPDLSTILEEEDEGDMEEVSFIEDGYETKNIRENSSNFLAEMEELESQSEPQENDSPRLQLEHDDQMSVTTEGAEKLRPY